MEEAGVNVWLINTGWVGGAYGTGSRIKLRYTRAMITAALDGHLEDVAYQAHPIFGLSMPKHCPNVPEELLNPKNTWKDGDDYDKNAIALAKKFEANFEQYKEQASADVLKGAPSLYVTAE